MSRDERDQPDPRRDDLERLRDDQHRSLAVDVGDLARVPREQQEGQHEDGADDGQLTARRVGGRRVDGDHRDDDLEQVVVEGPEKLRPQERLQARAAKRVAIAVRGHVTPSAATIGGCRRDVLKKP
jgi:hypothetical protein